MTSQKCERTVGRNRENLTALHLSCLYDNVRRYRHGLLQNLLLTPGPAPFFGAASGAWQVLSFRKVHAGSDSTATQDSNEKQESDKDKDVTAKEEAKQDPAQSMYFEMLARKYIEKESGSERVHMIFVKNHKGDVSPEREYIQIALVQTFAITFFMKYIPTWFNAKKEFISQHRATVFRTRIEAARRMNDYVFMKSALEAGAFTGKITIFSAGFLFLSQCIASYKNQSGVSEYAIAAAITGGVARLTLGPKGIISGSIVGGTLGTVLGTMAYFFMKTFSCTQEERHLYTIKSRLEMEKSLKGEAGFHKWAKELMESPNAIT